VLINKIDDPKVIVVSNTNHKRSGVTVSGGNNLIINGCQQQPYLKEEPRKNPMLIWSLRMYFISDSRQGLTLTNS